MLGYRKTKSHAGLKAAPDTANNVFHCLLWSYPPGTEIASLCCTVKRSLYLPVVEICQPVVTGLQSRAL
jgi:hypothetical protein